MSEDYQHQKNQEELKIYFQNNIEDFFDNSKYYKYGRFLKIERAKIKVLFDKIPDLMVVSKSNNLVWVGEAKTSGDFNSNGEFSSRNYLQLKSYCNWLMDNKNKYDTHLLIYCVPSFRIADTKNQIKKFFFKTNNEINYKVISHRDD